MHRFSLQHLSDGAVLSGMRDFRRNERLAIAQLIGYMAEADERRLYVAQACDSMLVYCERELGMTTDEALKRIQAGRVARRFPRVFAMLEDGRLHLTAINLLAPHLSSANADALLDEASGRSKREIELQLKARFPDSEPLPLVTTVPASHASDHTALAAPDPRRGTEARASSGGTGLDATPTTPSYAPEHTNGRGSDAASAPPVAASAPRTRVTPHAGERYTLQLTLDQAAYDALRECEALLGHVHAASGLGAVVTRAIHELAGQLKKRKFAVGRKAARRVRSNAGGRYVPAHVRRAVYERDGGRCTFTNDAGQRCDSRRRLELDHIVPVARGGDSVVDNLRLRCRVHNQHEADCVFGEAFMTGKREAARRGITADSASGSRLPSRSRVPHHHLLPRSPS